MRIERTILETQRNLLQHHVPCHNVLISELTNSAQSHRISLPWYFLSLSLTEIKIQKKQIEISSKLSGGKEQDHRIVQTGSDLRRSLVQPPAHRRSALRSDHVLHLVKAENLKGQKLHNVSAHSVPLPVFIGAFKKKNSV